MKKRLMQLLFKRRVFIIIICMILIAVLVVLRKQGILCCIEKAIPFDATVFFAVLAETIIIVFAEAICIHFSKKYEDPLKLTTDYESLIRDNYCDYLDENLVGKQGGVNEVGGIIQCTLDDGKRFNLPIVFEGWLIDKKIKLIDNPQSHYSLPEMVVSYYDKIMSSHSSSIVYNSYKVRVEKWELEKDVFTIRTGRTTYYDSLVTNRAMDYRIEKHVSVRQLYEFDKRIKPLEDSLLSNHLGVNGFIEDADGNIILALRRDDLSIGKKLWTGSVSGSLKIQGDYTDTITVNSFYDAVIKEIEDETGITKSQLDIIDGKRITLIAAYRDLVEGGKPHLVFYAKCSLKTDSIKERFKIAKKNNKSKLKNNKSIQKKKELQTQMDAEKLLFIERDQLETMDLSCDSFKVKRRLNKKYPSSPSYIAGLWLLRQYYRNDE